MVKGSVLPPLTTRKKKTFVTKQGQQLTVFTLMCSTVDIKMEEVSDLKIYDVKL